MKHAVESLDGALLDAAVAEAAGWTPGVFEPSVHWAHGGPLIERERIDIEHISNRGGDSWDDDLWVDEGDPPWRATAPCSRQISPYGVIEGYGDTPLVAAMRAYVASRFGTEVEL